MNPYLELRKLLRYSTHADSCDLDVISLKPHPYLRGRVQRENSHHTTVLSLSKVELL